MARLKTMTIPSTLEMSNSFEAADVDRNELFRLREDIMTGDAEDELKSVFGRIIDQLTFLRATWGRFQQFVQRRPKTKTGSRSEVGELSGNVMRGEVTTEYETIPSD